MVPVQEGMRHAVSIPSGLNTNNPAVIPSTLAVTKPTLDLPPRPAFTRAQSVPNDEPVKPRRVRLGPGCGLLDWIRLTRNTKDIAGTGGKLLTVTDEELEKHCTEDDAWTCIRGEPKEELGALRVMFNSSLCCHAGKVYNITPYFRFHPGGKEDLLKAAGIDSTILFDEVCARVVTARGGVMVWCVYTLSGHFLLLAGALWPNPVTTNYHVLCFL